MHSFIHQTLLETVIRAYVFADHYHWSHLNSIFCVTAFSATESGIVRRTPSFVSTVG